MTVVPDHVPVLVVGGGPSGLAAAIELGRRGIDVLVVEPRTRVGAGPCHVSWLCRLLRERTDGASR